MTDTEINIAIAEACGWLKQVPCNKCGHGTHQWLTPDGLVVDKLTDYCHDLNAMHEVEGVLSKEERRDYFSTLCSVCEDEWDRFAPEEPYSILIYIHATSRQRAEAFLRVKGLWKEGA